jgi:hypothetical protein
VELRFEDFSGRAVRFEDRAVALSCSEERFDFRCEVRAAGTPFSDARCEGTPFSDERLTIRCEARWGVPRWDERASSRRLELWLGAAFWDLDRMDCLLGGEATLLSPSLASGGPHINVIVALCRGINWFDYISHMTHVTYMSYILALPRPNTSIVESPPRRYGVRET